MMQNIRYSPTWSIIPFFISIILLFVYFGEAILEANEWVYGLGNDSFKNTYYVLLATKYAEGFWLPIVNYPWGEHISYLDAQPFLVYTIRVLGLENYTIAIVHLLPLFSLTITSVFIFLIQRKLKLPLWYNLITAVIIAFLSPQILRMYAHFGLGYCFFIPMIFYVLMIDYRYSILKFISLLAILVSFGFTHPYYLMIGVALLVAFSPYYIFGKWSIKSFLGCFVISILSILIVKGVLNYTDIIIDRPENPFGIETYRSLVEGIFAPTFKPLKGIVRFFWDFPLPTFEARAYVGILGFPMFLILALLTFIRILTGKSVAKIFGNKQLQYLFIASFFVWIVSMYLPFKHLIDFVLNIIPSLKQFRGLGRFSWIFYYAFSLVMSYQLYRFFIFLKNKTNNTIAFSTLLLLLSLWFLDVNGGLNELKGKINNRQCLTPYEYTEQEVLMFKENEFDIILTLPIFHVGSEIESFVGYDHPTLASYLLVDELEIPILSTFSSRVSSSQFYQIEAIREEGIIPYFLKNKKILLVADVNLLLPTEKTILDKGHIFYEKDGLVYAEFVVYE